MSLISQINLGVSLIKSGVDVTAITYRAPSEFGWEPGWETFEIVNQADYLHEDFINLLSGLNIPYYARLNRLAPSYQFPIGQAKPGFVHTQLVFVLSGQLETQIFDLTGYAAGSIQDSPYPVTDPDFNAEFLMKPDATDSSNPLSYLKPGDTGIGGSIIAPAEVSSGTSVKFDSSLSQSARNTSSTDHAYSLVLVTYNVTKEYVDSALQPFVIV